MTNKEFRFNTNAEYDIIGNKIYIKLNDDKGVNESSNIENYFEFEGEAAQLINGIIESCSSLDLLVEKFRLDTRSKEIVQNFLTKLVNDNILIVKELI